MSKKMKYQLSRKPYSLFGGSSGLKACRLRSRLWCQRAESDICLQSCQSCWWRVTLNTPTSFQLTLPQDITFFYLIFLFFSKFPATVLLCFLRIFHLIERRSSFSVNKKLGFCKHACDTFEGLCTTTNNLKFIKNHDLPFDMYFSHTGVKTNNYFALVLKSPVNGRAIFKA